MQISLECAETNPSSSGGSFQGTSSGSPKFTTQAKPYERLPAIWPFSVLTLPIPKVWTVRFIPDMRHSLSIDSVEALRESSAYNG
jgi:hypothetical protein